MKRLMALLCAVLLLGCGSAIAASAGSAQDPLLYDKDGNEVTLNS